MSIKNYIQIRYTKLNLIPAAIFFILLYNIQLSLLYGKINNNFSGEKGTALKGFSKDSFLGEQVLSFGYSPI